MLTKSKISAGIATLSVILAPLLGGKGNFYLTVINSCFIFCSHADTASAAKPTIIAENVKHHVELLADGRYFGRDRATGEQITLSPNFDRKSWSNKGHLYEFVSETMSDIRVRVTFPDGHQVEEVLRKL